MRSDISHGDGVYKSVDGGRTWAHAGLSDTRQIGRILVDPRDPNLVFVAALGHGYGPNPERGVFRSRDGGKTWSRVLFQDEHTGAIDLAFSPGNTKTIFAALWQTRRPPWNVYAALERSRQRPLSVRRRRRQLEAGARQRVACGKARPYRSRVRALRSLPALCDGRREGGRSLRVARRGRHVEARVLGSQDLGPRVVFRRRHGGSQKRGHGLRLQHIDLPFDGWRRDLSSDEGRSDRRRFSRALDRPGGSEADDHGVRPGHGHQRGRRADLELLVQPADGADLPRRHGRPVPVLGLRRAAGQRRRRHSLAHGLPEHPDARLAADRGRRGEGRSRRTRRTRTSSSAERSGASTRRRSASRT